MTSENELFDHFAGPSSTNVFIWWVYLLLSLFIASSDLRRNKKACNCRNASNSVSLDEPLLIVSLFVTHRLTLWPCCAIIGGETKSGDQVYIQGYTI